MVSRGLLVLSAGLLLAGCGGSTAQGTTPSASPGQVKVATPSPSATPSSACLTAPLFQFSGQVATCVSVASGNFDGKSTDETIDLYTVQGQNPGQQPYWVRAYLANQQVLTVDLRTLHQDISAARFLGAADANGDGKDEVFVVLKHDSTNDSVAILGVVAQNLRLASVVKGSGQGSDLFPLGGNSTHFNTLDCQGNSPNKSLVATDWSTPDGGKTFNWQSSTYSWSGLDLTNASSSKGSTSTPPSPAPSQNLEGLHCPPLGTGV